MLNLVLRKMKAVSYNLNGERKISTNSMAITIDNCINMDYLPSGACNAKIVDIEAPVYLQEEYEAMCEMYGENSIEALSVKQRMSK